MMMCVRDWPVLMSLGGTVSQSTVLIAYTWYYNNSLLTNMLKELDNNLNESKNLNDDTSKNKKHYVTIKKSTKLSLFSALF